MSKTDKFSDISTADMTERLRESNFLIKMT